MAEKKKTQSREQSPKNMIKKALSLPTMGSKKARVAILTAVAGGSLLIGYWGGSAANNQNTSTIATFNSGVVTNKALYSYLKDNTNGSTALKWTLIYDVFGNIYGDKISDEDVQTAYNAMTANSSGLSYLVNANNTKTDKKSLLKKVKQELAYEYGVKEHIKVSDAELKTAWASYRPNVNIQMLVLDNKETADSLYSQVQNGADIETLAKNNQSLDGNSGKVFTYQNASNYFDEENTELVYNLKDGETALFTMDMTGNNNSSTGPNTYYCIVKMVKNKDKGTDMSAYKKELENLVKTQKMSNDSTMVNNIIKAVFKKANVKVTDPYMQAALKDYLR